MGQLRPAGGDVLAGHHSRPGQEEARAPEEEREEKGLMDKAKGLINEVGGTKDHVRDELDEAAERGRREGDNSKEAVPEEVGQPGSGGKDNVRGAQTTRLLEPTKAGEEPSS